MAKGKDKTKVRQSETVKDKARTKAKKIKRQIVNQETVKSAKLVLTIIFVVLTALFSYGRNLNSYIPTWPQIYEFVGIPLDTNSRVVEAPLVVSFIDVGQGDCIFIKTENADILIDSGEIDCSEVVLDYLNLYGVDDLEYMIATHPHSDHVAAMPEIMKKVDIEKFVLPVESEKTTDGAEYRNELMRIAKGEDIEIVELPFDSNYEIVLGELKLKFLGPIVDDDNLNNTSLIIKLTFGETSFLFTGDAEKLEEYTLASRDFEKCGETLKSDVLKVAHHGSNTSSTSYFIEAVNPRYAVISCGIDNEYGHPHNTTIEALANTGAKTLRTDLLGTVIIASDGKEVLYRGLG